MCVLWQKSVISKVYIYVCIAHIYCGKLLATTTIPWWLLNFVNFLDFFFHIVVVIDGNKRKKRIKLKKSWVDINWHLIYSILTDSPLPLYCSLSIFLFLGFIIILTLTLFGYVYVCPLSYQWIYINIPMLALMLMLMILLSW